MHRNFKLVLIDCNAVFRSLMRSFANSRGLDLECFGSVLDMGSVSRFSSFDVAIIENDTGTLSGIEVGEYLTALFKAIPLILISCGQQPTQATKNSWPIAIKAFVHKKRRTRCHF